MKHMIYHWIVYLPILHLFFWRNCGQVWNRNSHLLGTYNNTILYSSRPGSPREWTHIMHTGGLELMHKTTTVFPQHCQERPLSKTRCCTQAIPSSKEKMKFWAHLETGHCYFGSTRWLKAPLYFQSSSNQYLLPELETSLKITWMRPYIFHMRGP